MTPERRVGVLVIAAALVAIFVMLHPTGGLGTAGTEVEVLDESLER